MYKVPESLLQSQYTILQVVVITWLKPMQKTSHIADSTSLKLKTRPHGKTALNGTAVTK